MKAASNAPKDPKMKALLTAQASTDKEETTSGLVFTRKRKILATTTDYSFSVGRAPFYQEMAKRMKAASNAPKDPKMKALLTAQASTDKEETKLVCIIDK